MTCCELFRYLSDVELLFLQYFFARTEIMQVVDGSSYILMLEHVSCNVYQRHDCLVMSCMGRDVKDYGAIRLVVYWFCAIRSIARTIHWLVKVVFECDALDL